MTAAGHGLAGVSTSPEPVPTQRPTHDLWAVLIARINEVFPLLRPACGGQMRIIAFITYSAGMHHILELAEAQAEPLCVTPARGPPLWDGADAQIGEVWSRRQIGMEWHSRRRTLRPISA